MPMLPGSLGWVLAGAWQCGGGQLGKKELTSERRQRRTWVRRDLRDVSFSNSTHHPSSSFTCCPTCIDSLPLELRSRKPLALTVRSRHRRASWLCSSLSTDTAALECQMPTGGKQEAPCSRCFLPCHPPYLGSVRSTADVAACNHGQTPICLAYCWRL